MSVTVERCPAEDFVRLAAETVFVRGRARYRRADLAGQLARFDKPAYVVAREHGTVLGGCVLDQRRLRIDGQPVHGVYRALLSVRATCQGQGIGRRIVAAGLAEADRLAHTLAGPVLSYGCIDADNMTAQSLLEAQGARSIGTLVPHLAYRQWPRQRLRLERLVIPVQPDAARLVGQGDAECSVRDETPPSSSVAASVSTWSWNDARGPAIVADAAVSTLSFDTLGRVNDALVGALVTPFGFARRRFDKRAFRYVRLTRLGVRAGAEHGYPAFVDSVLKAHGCHYAMLVIDPARALAQRLGLTAEPASLQVMARWHTAHAPPPLPVAGALGVHPVDV